MAKTATSYGEKDGNDPRKGKAGPGRRPKSLVLHLRTLRRSAAAQKALEAAATDPESKNFKTAWKVLSDYDDEKPAEKKQISGDVTVRVKFSNE